MKISVTTKTLFTLMIMIGSFNQVVPHLSRIYNDSLFRSELSKIEGVNQENLYLPFVQNNSATEIVTMKRRINLPYFETVNIREKYSEMAIAWFGTVSEGENYADIRVAYNDEVLFISLNIFDRILWYDTDPSPIDLIEWDAVTVNLNLDNRSRLTPSVESYRFDAQLNHWEPREQYQVSYRGNGEMWVVSDVPFNSISNYRGEGGVNNGAENRGWTINLRIPFTSLGLADAPSNGTVWSMGIALHDRDDPEGTYNDVQTWPENFDINSPASWGEIRFGLVNYDSPEVELAGESIIRHKLDGAVVEDAAVGGTTTNLCPGDSYFIWNIWGNLNFAGAQDFNIQNQGDVADWPCFAKYYVSFPLNSIPPGQEIISADLRLYQFGNSGDVNDPDPINRPRSSLIQVLRVIDEWDEANITWNNAPMGVENISQAWVEPLYAFPGWPGVLREWDVSYAANRAYQNGQSLKLVLYEADATRHSGKYFSSSETGDWNEIGRPTLVVQWGEP